jgi:hypothetical protein
VEEREEVEEHASWLRLQIFFQLPGRVYWGTDCVFDFENPQNRDVTETVRTLAHLARCILADPPIRAAFHSN